MKKPEIIGGPVAHALADWFQSAMKESGSPDLDVVEVDADGNEVRRLRLKNASLLRVEVPEANAVDAASKPIELKFDHSISRPSERDNQGGPMPTAPTETKFPTEALARLRARHEGLMPEDPSGDRDQILKEAIEVIDALESDAAALRNTIDFMRDRVQKAIAPR